MADAEGRLEACPACGASGAADPAPARGLPYLRCRACGSRILAEPPEFDAYYRDYFPRGVRDDSPVLARRYADILARLAERAPGRRLIEVGFGNAQLLAQAAASGWDVAGTELSEAQVEHARGRGLDVRAGDLARDGLFAGRRFDAAVLIEVVEHLPEPAAVLEAVAERLAPGGVLYVTTPNVDALSRRLLDGRWSVFDREHVTLLSPRGLRSLLRRSGFEPLRLRSRNVNLAELRRELRPGASTAAGGARFDRPAAAAELRDRIEGSPLLRAAKAAANAALGATGAGDGLVAWARREGIR